jgi:hypothetical protein
MAGSSKDLELSREQQDTLAKAIAHAVFQALTEQGKRLIQAVEDAGLRFRQAVASMNNQERDKRSEAPL